MFSESHAGGRCQGCSSQLRVMPLVNLHGIAIAQSAREELFHVHHTVELGLTHGVSMGAKLHTEILNS